MEVSRLFIRGLEFVLISVHSRFGSLVAALPRWAFSRLRLQPRAPRAPTAELMTDLARNILPYSLTWMVSAQAVPANCLDQASHNYYESEGTNYSRAHHPDA